MATYRVAVDLTAGPVMTYTSFSGAVTTCKYWNGAHVYDDTGAVVYPPESLYFVGTNTSTGTSCSSFENAKALSDSTGNTVLDSNGVVVYPKDLFYWGRSMDDGSAFAASSFSAAKSMVDSFNAMFDSAEYKVFDRNGTLVYPIVEYYLVVNGTRTMYSTPAAARAALNLNSSNSITEQTMEPEDAVKDIANNTVATRNIYKVELDNNLVQYFDNYQSAVNYVDNNGVNLMVSDENNDVIYRARHSNSGNTYYVGPSLGQSTYFDSYVNAVTTADASATNKVFDPSGAVIYPIYHGTNENLYHHEGMCESKNKLDIISSHLTADISTLERMC